VGVAKGSVWQHVCEGGTVAEAMRVALDDTSPAVIAAAAESICSLLGTPHELRDSYWDLQLEGARLVIPVI